MTSKSTGPPLLTTPRQWPGLAFGTSSFVIVPVAAARPSTALTAPESANVSVSSASTAVSPAIGTSTLLLVSPGANVSWPLVAV